MKRGLMPHSLEVRTASSLHSSYCTQLRWDTLTEEDILAEEDTPIEDTLTEEDSLTEEDTLREA